MVGADPVVSGGRRAFIAIVLQDVIDVAVLADADLQAKQFSQ